MYLVRTYVVLDERLIDPWYLVSYYTVDSRGHKGRTCSNIPVVTSKVETNAAYSTRTLLHTNVWHEIIWKGRRACWPCMLDEKKRLTGEVELTGRGCFRDRCHVNRSVREAAPARNITVRKSEPK